MDDQITYDESSWDLADVIILIGVVVFTFWCFGVFTCNDVEDKEDLRPTAPPTLGV